MSEDDCVYRVPAIRIPPDAHIGERIGLIDADFLARGKMTYPNLALMKLSAWHKAKGDVVEWYKHFNGPYNRVYVSKVFSDEYTPDIDFEPFTFDTIYGGSGYAIKVENGREVYHKELDKPLPEEIEHIMPDYSLYGIEENAHGFLSRGCPRGCDFCHVAGMQGRTSHKVADLNEFWQGESIIHLYDPNILACKEWGGLFEQLIESKARVDFNQGLDIRFLDDARIEALNRVKYSMIHFAWDRPEEDLMGKFEYAKSKLKKCSKSNTMCYVLCNNGEPFEEDVRRVELLKSLKIQPYVMIYRENTASKELKQLKRYANNPYVCWGCPSWEDYKPSAHSERFGKTGMKHKEVKKTLE